MEVANQCFGVGLRLVLVYFDVDKSRTEDGFHRNRRIQEMVEGRIEREGGALWLKITYLQESDSVSICAQSISAL